MESHSRDRTAYPIVTPPGTSPMAHGTASARMAGVQVSIAHMNRGQGKDRSGTSIHSKSRLHPRPTHSAHPAEAATCPGSSRPSCPCLALAPLQQPPHFLSEPQLWLPSAHHAGRGPALELQSQVHSPGANPARRVQRGHREDPDTGPQRPPILLGEAVENSPLNRRDPEASPEQGGGARAALQSSAV